MNVLCVHNGVVFAVSQPVSHVFQVTFLATIMVFAILHVQVEHSMTKLILSVPNVLLPVRRALI